MHLLLECAIFLPVDGGISNYYQLSGIPMPDLKLPIANSAPPNQSAETKNPSAITFVRSRMMYAKAALNAKGGVRFGMRHIR
jgi:telomerase reverse transcriptase